MKNYEGVTNGDSQVMIFGNKNESDDTSLSKVVSDMADSSNNEIRYGSSLDGENGVITISQQEAEKMKSALDDVEKQAKVLEGQKIKVSELNRCIEEGDKKLSKTLDKQREKAKKELASFTKVSDSYQYILR